MGLFLQARTGWAWRLPSSVLAPAHYDVPYFSEGMPPRASFSLLTVPDDTRVFVNREGRWNPESQPSVSYTGKN